MHWKSPNLILVGGPGTNPLVSIPPFNDLSPVEYTWDDVDGYTIISRTSFREVHPESVRRVLFREIHDFGYFLKRRFQPVSANKLIMISGLGSLGTANGAILFSNPNGVSKIGQACQKCKSIVNRLGTDPSFICFFEVKGRGILTPDLDFNKVQTILE
jgi:hypothetical protein